MSVHVAQLVQLGALNDSCKAAVPTCETGVAKDRHPTRPQRKYQNQSLIPDCQIGDCASEERFTTRWSRNHKCMRPANLSIASSKSIPVLSAPFQHVLRVKFAK